MIEVKKVFHLSCPARATLYTRLKKRALKDNRLDDANDEVIRRRLETYEKESKPVLDYYPKEIIRVVDANEPPAKVRRHRARMLLPEMSMLPSTLAESGFVYDATVVRCPTTPL